MTEHSPPEAATHPRPELQRKPTVTSAPDPVQADAGETDSELVNRAPCGLLVTTSDGIVTRANDTFLRWTGHDRASVLGTPFDQLLTVGSQLFYATRYLPVLRLSGEVREVALTLRCANGGSLPVLVNSSTEFAADSSPRLVRTAIFDSTQRSTLERELLLARRLAEASEARVRVLQDAGALFGACDSEAGVAEALVNLARHAFRATAAAVLLLDEGGEMRLAAGHHPLLDALAGTALRRPEAEALNAGRAVTIVSLADAQARFPDLADALRATRLEAVCAIPLLGGDRSQGLLICFYGRERGFDDDVLALQAALALQAVQVLARVRLHAELHNLALYDPLTGLANRTLVQHTLGATLLSVQRHRTGVGVIFLDLDGFKAVNDGLGHQAGDAVLKLVAQRLRSVVRGNDTLARFGGDEFVVVCDDLNDAKAHAMAERIRLAVRQPLPGIAALFTVTASLGIALYHAGEGTLPTAEAMLRKADQAMYATKSAGKDGSTIVSL